MPAPFIREHHGDSTFEARSFVLTNKHARSRWYVDGKVVSAAEWERRRQAAMAADADRAAARSDPQH